MIRINFENEYCTIVCSEGINIIIDREMALYFAKQIQDFYENPIQEEIFYQEYY